MGVCLRSYKTTDFISSFVVPGRHTLLHVVTIIFELLVSNSVVSAVWQICNVQCGSWPEWDITGMDSVTWSSQQLTALGQIASPSIPVSKAHVLSPELDFDPWEERRTLDSLLSLV